MKQFPAGAYSRSPGDLFAEAAKGPVIITKHRKPRFVLMSAHHYAALTGKQPQDLDAGSERGADDDGANGAA